MTKTFWIGLGVVVVVILGAILFWPKSTTAPAVTTATSTPGGAVACTMEAKICPDGSSVGRSGPLCEFAACPGATSTSALKTYSAAGISFMYPEKLSTTYITAVDWPPKVVIQNQGLSCTEAGVVNATGGKTEKKTINGKVYCVTTEAEGAAGSTYLNYAYATSAGTKTATLTFSIREVQCLNYDEPKSSQCTAERNAFQIDPVVDSIVNTLKVS